MDFADESIHGMAADRLSPETVHWFFGRMKTFHLETVAPCMTASALSRIFFGSLAGKRAGWGVCLGRTVSRARSLRSSRPLTPAFPNRQWSLERISDVLSEIRSIVEKDPSSGINDPSSRVDSIIFRWTHLVPPTMYSARYCTMIACSNSLNLQGRRGVQSVSRCAFQPPRRYTDCPACEPRTVNCS